MTNAAGLAPCWVMVKKTTSRKKAALVSRPIEALIHVIRGQKVMLDADLAALYEVPTSALNQAVKRNRERFPEDFLFELTREEAAGMRSQSVTASKRNVSFAPRAFTEQGVAMLSAVLRSERALQMSIAIVRTFVRMRELMAANKDIATRVAKLERGHDRTASVIEVLVDDIDRLGREVKDLKALPPVTKRRIGFVLDDE